MHIEEHGKENNEIIVMLHALNNIYIFREQYKLKNKYRIIAPHLMGFSDETDKIFNAEKQIDILHNFIKTLNQKVTLVGFSLGAEIALKLLCEHKEFFNAAVIISPWLCKNNNKFLEQVKKGALNGLKLTKIKWICWILCILNKIPKTCRKNFINQMKHVSQETVISAVNNEISFETITNFNRIDIPVTVLVGENEMDVVKTSANKLKEANPNFCDLKIIKKAGHNIPVKFADELNSLLESVCSRT